MAKRLVVATLLAASVGARRPFRVAPGALARRGGETAEPSMAESLKLLADEAQRTGDLETAATCYVEALDAIAL